MDRRKFVQLLATTIASFSIANPRLLDAKEIDCKKKLPSENLKIKSQEQENIPSPKNISTTFRLSKPMGCSWAKKY